MKIYLFILVACFFIQSDAKAQKINQALAKQLLSNTLAYLKTNDTTAFIGQYSLDNKPWPYHTKPFTRKQALGNFAELRKFLDTAINQNMQIDHVDIEKQNPKDSDYIASYSIKAWFVYNNYYHKGFGFYVDYINNKWCYRYSPDYSSLIRPKDKNK